MNAIINLDNFNLNENHLYENDFKDNIIETRSYYLNKNEKTYAIKIMKKNLDILIKAQKYEIQFNEKELSILTKIKFNSIDDAYTYITNVFEQKRVKIKKIKGNKSLLLLLKVFINNKKQDIEITLISQREDNNLIIDKLIYQNNQLRNSIINIKNELMIIKKEITELKSFNNNINKKHSGIEKNKPSKKNNNKESQKKEKNNNKKLKILDNFAKDSYAQDNLDNTFTIFQSIHNILNLIYSTKSKSIIAYDLIDNKKIIEIKQAHQDYITNIRHYLDEIKKKDFILSISGHDNNLKIWNFSNWDCICDIININSSGDLDSACIINNNNKNYILTSNDKEQDEEEFDNSESIKVFDFKGNKIKELNDSNCRTLIMDAFYDNLSHINYVITGNEGFVKSYDYENNKSYHKYEDSKGNSDNIFCHTSLIVNCYIEAIKLIESSWDGNIRIWDFHTGKLLNKINIGIDSLQCICLWDNNHLFAGCGQKLKLIDINERKVINDIKVYKNEILTIKKIEHPFYGKCLIFQGSENNYIKLLFSDNCQNP